MENLLLKYQDQITEIVVFAKRTNYNIDNGVDELVRLWLNDSLRVHNILMENKSETIRMIKFCLK